MSSFYLIALLCVFKHRKPILFAIHDFSFPDCLSYWWLQLLSFYRLSVQICDFFIFISRKLVLTHAFIKTCWMSYIKGKQLAGGGFAS